MRRIRLLVLSVFAALGVMAPAAEGADYFLEINGIPGESLDAKQAKSVELHSYSWGVTRPPTTGGTGGTTGRPAVKELSVQKNLDVTSPQLFRRLLQGTQIPHMELIGRKAGAQQVIFLRMCFQSVQVTSINQSDSDGGTVPAETVTFYYNTVAEQYFRQNPDGTLQAGVFAGWNQTTGALMSAYPTTCGN